MERRQNRPRGPVSAGRSQDPARKVSPGIQRAMRGLRGFAAQASGAYSKLGDTLKQIIPTVETLGVAFSKLRTSLGAVIGTTNQANSAFGRLRTSLVSLVPIVAGLVVEFGALSKALATVGGSATAAMGGLTAAAGKAAVSSGILSGSFLAIAAPVALVAAAIGTAYVAIFKWQEVPTWLKAILVVASPLVMVIRAIATAFNVATAPIRLFRATMSGAIAAVIAPLRLLQSTAKGVSTGIVSSVKAIGNAFLSLPVRFALPSFGWVTKAFAGMSLSIKVGAAEIESAVNRIVNPMKQAADEFATAGTEAKKLADASGLSVEAMTALGYAAEKVGGTASGLSSAVATMNTALEDAQNGGQDAAAAFAALGVNTDQLAAMNPEQRFIAMAEAINSLASPLERAEMAQRIFGASGASLLPMLDKGRAGLQQMRDEAGRLGLVMSGPQAQAAKALTDAYAMMKNAVTGLWRTIGAAVAPQLTIAAQNMSKLVSAVTAWLAKNQPLIAQLFKVASTVATIAGGLVTLGAALSTVTPQMVALGAATVGGWLAWTRYGEAIQRALGSSMRTLQTFLDEAQRVAGGVWAAIEGGDLELAVQVAMAGAAKAWVDGWRLLASISGEAMGGIFNAIAEGDWSNAIDQVWSLVQEGFTAGVDMLDSIFTGLTSTVDSAITYIRQGINDAISELARLAMAALDKANTVASILARVDPTGQVAAIQTDIAKGLKGSGLATAAAGSDEANRALGLASQTRAMDRANDLTNRSTIRQNRIDELRDNRAVGGAAAAAGAANAANAADARLADLIAKANAARDAARGQQAGDAERRNKLAEVAKGGGGGAGTGATFSAAALQLMGGRGSAQERAAKAAEATAGKLDQLLKIEAKRVAQDRAMLAQWTA